MIKIIELMKRNPTLTVAEFRAKYEPYADAVAEQIEGTCAHYVRRYAEPLPGGEDVTDYPFDVVTEQWFESEDDLTAGQALYARPEFAHVAALEGEIFDIPRTRVFTVLEMESPNA